MQVENTTAALQLLILPLWSAAAMLKSWSCVGTASTAGAQARATVLLLNSWPRVISISSVKSERLWLMDLGFVVDAGR